MKTYTAKNGRGEQIILFVLIPHCAHCRERVKRELDSFGCWERVEIGYPGFEGSPVSLFYDREKRPETDFWARAEEAKRRLNALGYRVL